MIECNIGMLARSKAGHDKDKVYVIINMDDTYVYLVDGNLRTLNKPKKKKWKHVQLIKRQYDIRETSDVKIKRILRLWNQEEKEMED